MKDITTKKFLSDQQPWLLPAGSAPLLLKPANSITETVQLKPKNETNSLLPEDIVNLNWSDFYRVAVLLLTQINSIQNFRHPACLCQSLKKGAICPYCNLTVFYQQKIEDRKLSVNAWVTLQKILKIKIENPKLTVRQVKNCRHLLIWLTDKCNLMKSGRVKEDELRLWLETKLPKSYEELLPLISGQATKGKSATQNPKKAEKKKRTANQELEVRQPKSEGEIEELPKRKPISNQIFNEVARRQGMYCFWCGVEVVREKQIPSSVRIKRKNSKIIYLQNGVIRQATAATVDHLERVCEGGSNDPENLVISCYPCNQKRSYQRLDYLKRVEKVKNTCPNCQSKFVRFDTKICSICGVDASEKKSFLTKIKLSFESFRRLIRTVF